MMCTLAEYDVLQLFLQPSIEEKCASTGFTSVNASGRINHDVRNAYTTCAHHKRYGSSFLAKINLVLN